jgi:hypothetical protein
MNVVQYLRTLLCCRWVEKEVGKLIAPVEMVDDALDNWSCENHVTMGEQESRQIS